MKKTLIALALFATLSASAQQRPPLPAPDQIKNGVVALLVAFEVTLGAVVSGKLSQLCTALGGTFVDRGAGDYDRCPDGQWSNLLARTK